MAFERRGAATPYRIGEVRIQLISADPQGPNSDAASFRVEVVYSRNGTTDSGVEQIAGDLVPQLQPAEIAALLDFMASLRARAEAQILPQTT